jgi:hypothetical protein
MPGGYLHGWDGTNEVWVKIVCDANGKLKIDPTLILENPPTEDQDKKAPTSEWAYDHWKDVAAHHAKFTAAEARAAINDIFGADGIADSNINIGAHEVSGITYFKLLDRLDRGGFFTQGYDAVSKNMRMSAKDSLGAYQTLAWEIYNGTVYEKVATEPWVDAKYDKLVGTLYWSCAGVHFDGVNPASDAIQKMQDGSVGANADGIEFIVNVDLPDGATVVGVEVFGNAAASAETWTLNRIALADATNVTLATANINTEDTSIDNATVDNSTYSYYFYTSSLDTDDSIYGARITYTL